MEPSKIIEVLARWVHVGAAGYWLAVGFYMWQIMRSELKIDSNTLLSYAAQMSRVSKLGKGMAISSGLTVVAGLVLYGALTYWKAGFSTLGPIILNLGVVVGVVGAIQAGIMFARANRAANAVLAGVTGTPTNAQVEAYRGVVQALLDKLPLHFGLVAFAFLAMVAGAAI